MIILSDLDDTITTHIELLIDTYNKTYPDDNKHTIDEITEWKIPDHLFKHSLFSVLEQDILQHAELKNNAFEVIKRLHDEGHKIVIISATQREKEMIDKRKWLVNTGLDKYIYDIIFTHHKELIRGDIFCDDKYENLIEWHNTNPNGLPILFTAQHNKNIDCEFIRVNNWIELSDIIDNYLLTLDK